MYEVDRLFNKPPEAIAAKKRAFLELTTLSSLDPVPIFTFDPINYPQIDLDRFDEGTVLRRKTVNTGQTDQRYYWYVVGPNIDGKRSIFMLINPLAGDDGRCEALRVFPNARLAELKPERSQYHVEEIGCFWNTTDNNPEWSTARIDVMQLTNPTMESYFLSQGFTMRRHVQLWPKDRIAIRQ